jgi:integrase
MVSPQAEPARRNRRKTLSDKQVAALPRKRKRYFHPDPEMPGHGVRVMPQGPHSFYVIARDRFRKQRWIRIAGTTEMTIDDSREIARSVIKRLRAGEEPFPPPPVKPDTVADVCANWLKRHVEAKGLRTGAEMRRTLQRHVLPVWGDRIFAEIKRSEVAKLLDHVEDNSGAWTADAVMAVLRIVATWYAERSDDYTSPFTRYKRRVPEHARKRDRVLSDDELRAVWKAAEADEGPFGAFVRILLLSAQRREKVAGMKWSDVSSDGTWTIPTEKREKGNAGTLRLPPQAMAIISAQPRYARSPWVFTGRNDGPIRGFARRREDFIRDCGVGNWHLHDLRRSARSLMSRAKVPNDIAERVLGHARRGIEGVYDKFEYREEKSLALRQLASLIEQIVHPPADNVVPLRQAEARP